MSYEDLPPFIKLKSVILKFEHESHECKEAGSCHLIISAGLTDSIIQLPFYKLTQNKIDCSIVDSITVPKRLQPCLHFIYRMNMTFQNLLLQWLRHLTIVFLLRTSAILEQAQMVLGLASVILIFLIFVSLNTIYVILSFSILFEGRLLSLFVLLFLR